MKNWKTVLIWVGVIVACFGLIFFGMTPSGRAVWNNWFYAVHKVDDVTSYRTLKTVEDTCRAMMASYTSDKLTWEQYKDETGEKQSWAEQAKMRANKTAASYNEYFLKNSYIWAANVPADIQKSLEYIQ